MQEFWFTALATFLYFTAFVAQLAEFTAVEYDTDDCEEDCDNPQYWVDAQIAAGVSHRAHNGTGVTGVM